jgi:2-methylcitrate dehydratase PrpD
MEGAAAITRQHSLAPEAIARVVVETFYEATCLNHPRPADTEMAQYSLPFPLAAALIYGNLGPRELVGEALHDERVLALAARVELVSADDLNARFPAERLARVTVHTADGRALHSGLVSPRGDPEAPWTDVEFEAKFRWLAEGLIPGERAEAILSAVRGVADAPDAATLIDLLAEPLDGTDQAG